MLVHQNIMRTTNRIILNTIILYAKILIVMVINLWTVPLLLRALGQSDYGLYQLVAGVVIMLSFINAAMTVSTQRYMSVAMGESDNNDKLNVIYNVSLLLHLIIGLVIVVFLEVLTPFLFDGFLNIELDRIEAAKWIYQFLIVSTFFTIISVPFDAELNAYENMMVFAIISIIDAVLRLALVLFLPYLSGDLLIIYGAGMAVIAIMNAIVKYGYTRNKYSDMYPSAKHFDNKVFKEMFSFAGWNTFSAFAMTGRNQGIAIILNLFLGTIVNAAYGIANQINGLLVYFSATLQKSFNPQLMISEGMKDNDRMLRFTISLSKMSIIAISVLALPLIFEMPYVLSLWLGDDVPEYAALFSRYILIVSIIYLSSTGLMSAIQSRGIVRNYTLTIACALILNLPVTYIILWLRMPVHYVMLGMICVEFICFGIRVYFAHRLCQLNIKEFLTDVIFPIYLIIGITSLGLMTVVHFMPESFLRLCISCIVNVIIFVPMVYYLVLSSTERQSLLQLFHPIKHYLKK